MYIFLAFQILHKNMISRASHMHFSKYCMNEYGQIIAFMCMNRIVEKSTCQTVNQNSCNVEKVTFDAHYRDPNDDI